MSMNVYLFFNGNSEEVINFYKEATNGTIVTLQRYSDTPMPCDEAQKNKIMHAILNIGGTVIMFSDTDGKRDVTFGDNFSLALDFKSETEIYTVFMALSKGGKVTMPLQDTFWGATYGMCTDKFGVNWMFNYDKPKNN